MIDIRARSATRDVIVIDDDPDLRAVVSLTLQLDGWQVITAADGSTGLETLAAAAVHGMFPTVVLDVQMPDVDGWQVLSTIRSDPALGSLPVLLCTVLAGDEALQRGYELGADGFVGKPFDIDVLVDEVNSVAAMGDQARRRRRAERIELLRERRR